MDCMEKIELIRNEMKKQGAKYHMISKLDDLMWLFNIRGNDVECNPVALCHAMLTDTSVILFIQKKVLDEKILAYFSKRNIIIHDYFEVAEMIKNMSDQGSIFRITSYNVCYTKLLRSGLTLLPDSSIQILFCSILLS